MYALCRIIGLKIGLSFEKSMPVLTRANITEINIKPGRMEYGMLYGILYISSSSKNLILVMFVPL